MENPQGASYIYKSDSIVVRNCLGIIVQSQQWRYCTLLLSNSSVTPPNLNSMFSKYLKNIGVLIYFSSIHIQSLQYEYMPACCQHHTSLILVGETPATSLSRLPCGLSTGVCYRLPRKIMDHHWIDIKQNTTETALKNKYVILILNRL